MKKILSILLCAVAMTAAAQSPCDITMGVGFAGNNAELTEQHRNYLKTVINNALADGNGVSSLESELFGITVTTNVVNEHILAGSPTKYVLNLSMTLSAGNLADGKQFSHMTLDLNGVGNSKGKAYNNAIHKLKAQNQQLISFASQAKGKVLDYYNRNYPTIIKEARTEASVKKYEDALYRLMCIPSCCKGYDAAMDEVKVVYKKYIDQQCHENLARAQAAWMSGFNTDNAAVAGAFLAEIYPDAACYSEAKALAAEIKQHMGEEWKFEMKKWSDAISVDQQQLKFAREIALAFAQNRTQPIIKL